MNSIATMPKRPSDAPSKESLALAAAMRSAKMTKAAIADHMDVSPGMVSQWANGTRPVSAASAPKLGRLLSIDPARISAGYANVQHADGGNVVPLRATKEQPLRADLTAARIANDIDAMRYALASLVAGMTTHRPTEALDVAATIRKTVPAKFRDQGFLAELVATLEQAKRK